MFLCYNKVYQKAKESCLPDELHIRQCARKHGLSENDIRHAWRNRKAMRVRDYASVPLIYVVAGLDMRGRMVEVLAAEREDGSYEVFHAMKLTNKIARELDMQDWR